MESTSKTRKGHGNRQVAGGHKSSHSEPDESSAWQAFGVNIWQRMIGLSSTGDPAHLRDRFTPTVSKLPCAVPRTAGARPWPTE